MSNDRKIAIVVARMGSTRVPGKSMIPLAGKPVIWHMLNIAKHIRGVADVCLATTALAGDDALADVARDSDVRCYRGHPEHVLDRIHGAATTMKADVIVDIGGDCPLLDPSVIDAAIDHFDEAPCDYLCNYDPPTFPEGLDVNIVTMQAVERAFHEALAPSQRVHPFSYLTRHPERFTIVNHEMSPDLSTYHWSLDFPDDVAFISAVYEQIYRPYTPIAFEEVLALIDKNEAVNRKHAALIKPPALHAFWNSPGIIRDMNNDIGYLSALAGESVGKGDIDVADRCYDEIVRIATELHRQTRHGIEARRGS